MTRYLYATAPDGTVLRRRTHRQYTEAVLVKHGGEWKLRSMHDGHRAALRGQAAAASPYGGTVSLIVPVSELKP
jgi:hypothetical protein